MGKDIKSYLDSLRNEKFRSVILYHSSQAEMDLFLKKLSEMINARLIELSILFKDSKDLCSQLDRFNISDLKQLIQKHAVNEEIAIITGMGFLWDTWDTDDRKNLLNLVRNQWNSYYTETHAGLVFGLPEDAIVTESNIIDNKGENRVLSLNQINAF